jgi:hypothetical protein
MALTLSILVQMIQKRIINKVYKSIQNLTKLETINILMTVVSLACHDPDFYLEGEGKGEYYVIDNATTSFILSQE